MPSYARPPFPGDGEEPEGSDAGGAPAAERLLGTVVRIEHNLASVLVGPELEPWDFPLELLPDSVAVDTVLVLEWAGRRLRFVELDPVTEMARGRPFDLRLRRTAKKVPFMRTYPHDDFSRSR